MSPVIVNVTQVPGTTNDHKVKYSKSWWIKGFIEETYHSAPYWFLWLKLSLLRDQADQILTVKLLSLLGGHGSKMETAIIKKTLKIVCKWLTDLKELYRTVFFCVLKRPTTAKHVLNVFPLFCRGRQEMMVVNILLLTYIKGQHEPVHKENTSQYTWQL